MLEFKVIDVGQVQVAGARELVAYWRAACGQRFAPRWGVDFSLEDLPPELIRNIFVVDLVDGGADFRYRFWGSNNVRHKGFEMTGKLLSEWPGDIAAPSALPQYELVLKERRPLAFLYFPTYKRILPGAQVTLRLPLSSDGETIDKIVCYQNLDEIPEAWEDLFAEASEA